MSSAFHVLCPNCREVLCEGDGVGAPEYTPCGCVLGVDNLRAEDEALDPEKREKERVGS